MESQSFLYLHILLAQKTGFTLVLFGALEGNSLSLGYSAEGRIYSSLSTAIHSSIDPYNLTRCNWSALQVLLKHHLFQQGEICDFHLESRTLFKYQFLSKTQL